MEDIIKAIGKSEYDMAAMLILLDNLEVNDLEKLLYFFVYKLIDRKMTESMFIEMIKYINRTKLDFSSLKHIKQIKELLKEENYYSGSNLLIILCDIKNITNELSKFINIILKSDESIMYDKTIKIFLADNNEIRPIIYNFEFLINFYEIINEAANYIRSFGKITIITHPLIYTNNKNNYDDKEIENKLNISKYKCKYKCKYIIDQFENNCKNEILDRLILLKNYFGINFLADIDIIIITIDDFLGMKYNDIVKYYFDCIKKIKRHINNHIKLYKNYIRLYKNYEKLIDNEIEFKNNLINKYYRYDTELHNNAIFI